MIQRQSSESLVYRASQPTAPTGIIQVSLIKEQQTDMYLMTGKKKTRKEKCFQIIICSFFRNDFIVREQLLSKWEYGTALPSEMIYD